MPSQHAKTLLGIRVTETEKARIQKAAEKAKKSVNEFILDVLGMRDKEKVKIPEKKY